ncbi:MAG: GNAT family N-acetyltransferase [Rhodospirillales bacterium]|nr:GNAT family N-acetyltransferase [Rhodospirillales bacterium]
MTRTGTNDLEIRPAVAGELPAIVCLLADDALGAQRERVEDPLPACYAEAFAEIAADPHQELIVAARGGTVVGCLQLTFIPGLSRQGALRAQIESVRVAASERGRALFEWAIARARTRGAVLMQLTTDKSRAQAHRFYEQLGFVASHEGMKLSLDPG